MNCLVSVIVPVYKINETLLRNCLQSLIDQTEPSAEFIVVDDGSPDKCGMIIDEYAAKDSRIVAVHTENNGVSVARNNGIERARGEYIIFVDGDDYAEPDMCEKTVSKMRETDTDILFFMHLSTSQKHADFVHDDSLEILSDEMIKDIHFGIVSQENPFEGVYTGAPWGKVFRRSVIESSNVRFVPGLKKCQDRVFVFDYLMHAKTASLYRYIGYHYVANDSSICHNFNSNIVSILGNVGSEFESRKVFIDEEDTDRYEEALDTMYMAFLYECVTLDFFHPDNKKSHKEKVEGVKTLLADERYADNLDEKNLKRLKGRKRKIVLTAVKHHMYRVAELVIKILA